MPPRLRDAPSRRVAEPNCQRTVGFGPLDCGGLPPLFKTAGSSSDGGRRFLKSGGKPPHFKDRGPDERQPFPRHRLLLPYSTCQKANGYIKPKFSPVPSAFPTAAAQRLARSPTRLWAPRRRLQGRRSRNPRRIPFIGMKYTIIAVSGEVMDDAAGALVEVIAGHQATRSSVHV